MLTLILSTLSIPTIFLIFGINSIPFLLVTLFMGALQGKLISYLVKDFKLESFHNPELRKLTHQKEILLHNYQKQNFLITNLQRSISEKQNNFPNSYWKDFEFQMLNRYLNQAYADKYLLWELANSNYSLSQRNFFRSGLLTVVILGITACTFFFTKKLGQILVLFKWIKKKDLKRIFFYE